MFKFTLEEAAQKLGLETDQVQSFLGLMNQAPDRKTGEVFDVDLNDENESPFHVGLTMRFGPGLAVLDGEVPVYYLPVETVERNWPVVAVEMFAPKTDFLFEKDHLEKVNFLIGDIFENASDYPGLVDSVRETVNAFIDSELPLPREGGSLPDDVPQDIHLMISFLENDSRATSRRLAATANARREFTTQRARLALQQVFESSGLGRINGVTLEEFLSIEPDKLIKAIGLTVRAYPNSNIGRGLYYILKKGTSQEAIDTSVTKFLTNGMYAQDVNHLLNILAVLEIAGETVSLDATRKFGQVADYVREVTDLQIRLETQGASKETISEIAQLARKQGLGFSTETLESFHQQLEKETARELSVLLAETPGGVVFHEMAVALIQAHLKGESFDNEEVLKAFNQLPKIWRIVLIRAGGEKQKWFNAMLMASSKASQQK